MFDRFTDHARKTMGYARLEVWRFNHDYIGTEHLLLGVVRVSDSSAATILRSLDVDFARVRAQVNELVPHGEKRATMGKLPFTPSAKVALELSREVASQLGHDDVGTAHLLLGLIREDGIATRVLKKLGVDCNRVGEACAELETDP